MSLIGLLNHAAAVVRPGRIFLRSLIDAASTVKVLDYHVHLSAKAWADIAWWHEFSGPWNGISLLPLAEQSQIVYSDAAGTWGCGASWSYQWFQVPWPESWRSTGIAPKELIPIILAAAVWGPSWAGQKICCYCDNTAVVYAVNKGMARDPQLMRLLRTLLFFCASFRMEITTCHIAGVLNTSADALSRNHYTLLSSLNPRAAPLPTPIPAELRELLFNRTLRWTSPSWTGWFNSILGSVSHH